MHAMVSLTLVLSFLLLWPGAAQSASTSQIADETRRTFTSSRRIINLWWLPVEYWMAAAREIGRDEQEIERTKQAFGGYLMLAVVDAEIRPDGSLDALSTAEIVKRIDIRVNDKEETVLRNVDPKVQQLAPDLTYILQASLVTLGQGLRILPLPNLGSDGKPILSTTSPGRMRVTYKTGVDEEVEFWWHGPLTAIVGPKKCGTGEHAEASWTHCPWDGTPLE
jgi:hypothetical protein